jgi:hypothetical protein
MHMILETVTLIINLGGQETGHGCFIINSKGVSYSHSNKEHNNIQTDFSYTDWDVIRVTTNGDELLLKNETSNKDYKMKIRLTPCDWNQACFCVLFRHGSVQI